MRARVPVSVRNRLLKLERHKPRNLPIGGWPPIMALDEWDELAGRMQSELVASAWDEPVPVAVLRLRPQVIRADDPRTEESGRSAVKEYLEAQLRSRRGL